MEKGFIHLKVIIVADEQTTKVAEPSKGSFDFPTLAITPQPTAIVEGWFGAPSAVRADQQHAAFEQTLPQRIAVVGAVGHDSQRPFLWTASATTGHRYLSQGVFGQSHFPRAGRDQSASQRNTLAVDHHHPLRAFAPLGFANSEAPFLAGAKLPSRKLSLQSNLPRWSNSERKARQILSHTPRCSQSRNLRQHVLALGYSLGRSRQRAPVLSTHRIPSSTRRFLRPRPTTTAFLGQKRFHTGPLLVRQECFLHSQFFTKSFAKYQYKITYGFGLMKPLLSA
jgi:hypothetical protein